MPAEIDSRESDKPTHNCGIGLIYSFSPQDLRSDLFGIGHALQHRGQFGAGIATDTGFLVSGSGLLKDAIDPNVLGIQLQNYWAMIHLRYGTSGGYGSENMQPVEVEIEGQKVHIAVNGNIPNPQRLRKYITKDLPPDASDTVLAAHVFASLQGVSMDERVLQFANLPEIASAANNMIIGAGENAYVVRDQFGLHPLVIGDYKNGGGVVIASETAALQKIGSQVIGEFPPGAILKCSPDGHIYLQEGTSSQEHHSCIFEPAYFSSPNSAFAPQEHMTPEEWMSVLQFRIHTGEIVARDHPVPHADFVVGMPDSGVPFSAGLASGLKKPYYPSVIRSHYNGDSEITRTFMQDNDMGGIAALVRGKLMPVVDPRLWKDKVVVIGDDSLVRGNTAEVVTKMLRRLGAKEIHWRYGYPPVQWPCHLGVSFRSREELLAAQMGNDWGKIANFIGADSVAFISHEGIIQAAREFQGIMRPRNQDEIYMANGFCGGCVTGVYPVNSKGTIFDYNKQRIQ
ncbi:hypothetical protein KBD81_00580 [Candidatus Woesebacteria bacterium]|nr:hypothetical protein [Candidatus Woesebacteria bacterium]